MCECVSLWEVYTSEGVFLVRCCTPQEMVLALPAPACILALLDLSSSGAGTSDLVLMQWCDGVPVLPKTYPCPHIHSCVRLR
jgi:hypothetical protein